MSDFTRYASISIADFEQSTASWVSPRVRSNERILLTFAYKHRTLTTVGWAVGYILHVSIYFPWNSQVAI